MNTFSTTVLFEDNDILVCHKPAGVATESASIKTKDMVSLVKKYLCENSGKSDPYLGVIHRLDQPVSGILVFAKTPAAAASLSAQVQTDDMGKYYTATVHGNLSTVNVDTKSVSDDWVLLTDYLLKDSKSNKAIIVNKGKKGPDGKPAKEAKLLYRIKSYNSTNDTTVLGIKLLTGRFHQIRAQLANIGHPILGDVKYGAEPINSSDSGRSGIALTADELHFKHPSTGKEMQFNI